MGDILQKCKNGGTDGDKDNWPANTNIYESKIRVGNIKDLNKVTGKQHIKDKGAIYILGYNDKRYLEYLNKYFLIYKFYTSKNGVIQEELEDLINCFKNTSNSQQTNQIHQFFENYMKVITNPNERGQLALNSAFQSKFCSDLIANLFPNTIDAKLIAFARLAIADLYRTIKRKNTKNLKQLTFYIVIQINEDEQKLLASMIDNQDHFMFSTFMKGFTKQKQAIDYRKKLNQLNSKLKSVLLYVTVKIDKRELYYDHGYNIYENNNKPINGDVIFNVFNFFQVRNTSRPSERQYDVTYGAIGEMKMKRDKNDELSKILNGLQSEGDLINSQTKLLTILGQKNDLNQIISQIKQSSSGKEADDQKMNIIDHYIIHKEYDKALELCKQSRLRFKAKRLEIIYLKGEIQECEQILKSLKLNHQELKKEDFQCYQTLELIEAKLMIKNGQKKDAKTKLQSLNKQIKKQYGIHSEYRSKQVIKALQSIDKNINESKKQDSHYGINIKQSIQN